MYGQKVEMLCWVLVPLPVSAVRQSLSPDFIGFVVFPQLTQQFYEEIEQSRTFVTGLESPLNPIEAGFDTCYRGDMVALRVLC